ncbi:GNAT family N-acetyltransferase [Arthrobacter sp. TmT3-37]
MVFPVALPDELQRDQVLLRALHEEDWRLEYDLSRVLDVPQWTYLPPDIDEARARRVMERTKEGHQQRIAGRYGIVVDGEVLGTAGMAWREGPEPAVFYALKPAGRGRGLATESVRVLADWIFGQGIGSVALQTITGNTASERVAERAGFHSTGLYAGTQHGRPVQLNYWRRRANSSPVQPGQ